MIVMVIASQANVDGGMIENSRAIQPFFSESSHEA